MTDDKFFYAKSGFAPYSDGSGFQVTTTVEQDTESSEPTISIEAVWRLPVHEWVAVARKIERMLDLVTWPAGDVGSPPNLRGDQ
jgi:hypothetical protein